MKTKIKIMIGISCLCATSVSAQFLPYIPANPALYTSLSNQTVGIGDFNAYGTYSLIQSHLHVNALYCTPSSASPPVDNGKLFRTDGDSTFDCQWQMFTGSLKGTTQKGRIFVPSSSCDFEMECSAYLDTTGVPWEGNLFFNTPQFGGGPTIRRMQINGPRPDRHQQGQLFNRTGYVGLNVNPASMNMPVSLLTLDGDAVTDGDAYRPWMKIGTYIGNNTDNMYVGMLDNVNGGGVIYNRSDAVIAWGNDSTTASSGGPDVLRFIFTNPDTIDAGEVWGSEAGRWEPNGNFGVGDFRISGFVPHNRIEDYSWLPRNLSSTQWLQLQDSTGQFRLTFQSNQNGMLGSHTDFQENKSGDLLVNPQNDSTPRFMGIGIRVLNAQTGLPQTPENTLEIMSGWHSPYYGSTNGSSGLKFRNMVDTNIPIPNPGKGVLAVDSTGVVIYVKDTNSGTGIGNCTTPTILSADGELNLNSKKLFFEGNGSGALNENDMLIGYSCPRTNAPAKLSVLQASGRPNSVTQPSIGILVANTDHAGNTLTTERQVIGIKSILPVPSPCDNYYNIAGWFEARWDSIGCPLAPQYALFVPYHGGDEVIGYNFSGHFNDPSFLLDVNGWAQIAGTTVPSDTILKKNVNPFKYGLKAIRNLNPVSYQYNGVGGFDTSYTYIGLIAENLRRNVPTAVRSSTIMKDSINRDTTTILNIYNEGVMYTAINAIKELDSSTTAHQNTDSVKLLHQQRTIDSLVNALASIQNCLNTLCNGGGDAPVHHSGSNGNSGDSTSSFTNVQEVMLSTNSNTCLLYQNVPNPFSTGTKINYYLPLGTEGATIVFYDSYGNQIKTVAVSQTGNGTLNITPDNLSAGIYSYSLIVNNNVIDTKRMIIQK